MLPALWWIEEEELSGLHPGQLEAQLAYLAQAESGLNTKKPPPGKTEVFRLDTNEGSRLLEGSDSDLMAGGKPAELLDAAVETSLVHRSEEVIFREIALYGE